MVLLGNFTILWYIYSNIRKIMKEFIKSCLLEAIGKEKKKKETKEPVKDSGSQYQKIQALLSNDIFNHSEIIRKLWGDTEDDATNRSLFRKKLNREVNDNGSPYQFDDSELTKIATILMNTSSEIRKTVGRQGKS